MANTEEKEQYEHLAPGRNEQAIVDRWPVRLTGDLAASTTIAASGEADEVIRIKGATRVRVRGKVTTSGTPRVRIIPMLATTEPSTVPSTEATTDTVSLVPTSATEFSMDFEPWGESYVTIEVAETGGANNLTVNYIEVFVL